MSDSDPKFEPKFVEYLRTGAKEIKDFAIDEETNKTITIYGRPRNKKGVMVAGVDPKDESKILIGFSMCHSGDKWDHVGGFHKKGHGINLACKRAVKFADVATHEMKVHNTLLRPLLKFVVKVMNCEAFKGKTPPDWAEVFRNFDLPESSRRNYFRNRNI